ncbi:MAG: hypothetical protein WB780_12790 [Candidatus Acidiferrales bacterium]
MDSTTNCASIKDSLIEYLRREIEVVTVQDSCVMTLPLKTVDDRLVDVIVERKTPDYFLVHDGGKSLSELFVQGIKLSESVRNRLETIAKLNGALLLKDAFTVGCKRDKLQDGIVAIGLCSTMAMLELIGHKPEFEEEPIASRVSRTLRTWRPEFIENINSKVPIKGKRFQHQFDFVVSTRDDHRTSAIKILTHSYPGKIQSERYAFLVLDIENTPYFHWPRCAIISKTEMWSTGARKVVAELSMRVLELRTGEESAIEEVLPSYMDELVAR